ncbi:Uncharacterized protein dnm_073250 [Desulfonema magnum]|uniref:Uncharacterized protein n=1 Tax=Desulfonema magnum TaxID=45655 RepID=A0A975BT91_9BACT|nr:Uncharacterized protein dnm_073250 [Desulfonema magnum]
MNYKMKNLPVPGFRESEIRDICLFEKCRFPGMPVRIPVKTESCGRPSEIRASPGSVIIRIKMTRKP